MRFMALDIGEKTVGVAISDELGIAASPRETLRRDGSEFDRLTNWIEREQVGEVVAGLPVSLDGSQGPSAVRVLEFVATLRARLTIPVVTWDERLTTTEAEKFLIATGASRAKRRKVVDQIAATLLLQNYLRAREYAADGSNDSGGFA